MTCFYRNDNDSDNDSSSSAVCPQQQQERLQMVGLSCTCSDLIRNGTGFLSLLCFAIVALTSLNVVRRRAYVLFYTVHVLIGPLMLILALWHWSRMAIYLCPGILYYIALKVPLIWDWIMVRWSSLSSLSSSGGISSGNGYSGGSYSGGNDFGGGVEVLSICHLPSNNNNNDMHRDDSNRSSSSSSRSCTSIIFQINNNHHNNNNNDNHQYYRPGQHVFLRAPSISHLSHPFTINTLPNAPNNRMEIIFRSMGNFTSKLSQSLLLLCEQEQEEEEEERMIRDNDANHNNHEKNNQNNHNHNSNYMDGTTITTTTSSPQPQPKPKPKPPFVLEIDGFYGTQCRVKQALEHDMIIFIAGGIGITPYLSMLHELTTFLCQQSQSQPQTQTQTQEPISSSTTSTTLPHTTTTTTIFLHWICNDASLIHHVHSNYFLPLIHLNNKSKDSGGGGEDLECMDGTCHMIGSSRRKVCIVLHDRSSSSSPLNSKSKTKTKTKLNHHHPPISSMGEESSMNGTDTTTMATTTTTTPDHISHCETSGILPNEHGGNSQSSCMIHPHPRISSSTSSTSSSSNQQSGKRMILNPNLKLILVCHKPNVFTFTAISSIGLCCTWYIYHKEQNGDGGGGWWGVASRVYGILLSILLAFVIAALTKFCTSSLCQGVKFGSSSCYSYCCYYPWRLPNLTRMGGVWRWKKDHHHPQATFQSMKEHLHVGTEDVMGEKEEKEEYMDDNMFSSASGNISLGNLSSFSQEKYKGKCGSSSSSRSEEELDKGERMLDLEADESSASSPSSYQAADVYHGDSPKISLESQVQIELGKDDATSILHRDNGMIRIDHKKCAGEKISPHVFLKSLDNAKNPCVFSCGPKLLMKEIKSCLHHRSSILKLQHCLNDDGNCALYEEVFEL
eukprot:CAMPEP_0184862712 /NCGR_PEP_ID=MMETSP0580-20130426/7112_1 /TAXON_ID=1118495 /ORGANISM="Dactyliosolen fragilissimus" /LENGTH=899 /DNA_ID=CAMNT_0027360673 /DNA_START=86 /DNA_END=2785 /DNA_ORIENTATION=-